ncbi:MAG TPA: hypothetical protein VFZ97_13795 [Acidimicrobiales bacterium]
MTDSDEPSLLFLRPVSGLVASLLLLAVVAAMVAALLQTISLTITNPVPVDGSSFSFIGSPPVDFADRLSVFTSAGTNLTIVLMLIAASVLSSLQQPNLWRRVTVTSVELLVVIVVVSDIVMAIEVGVSNGPLLFPGVDTTTRATAIVGLLAPAAVASAAGLVALLGSRHNAQKHEPALSPTDPE